MDLQEHTFYLRKLAGLEARIIRLEMRMAELFGDSAVVAPVKKAECAPDEKSVSRFISLN